LRNNYDVKAGAEETVNGVKATKLELVPKDKKAREYAAKVEMWVPAGQAYGVQVKVNQPNGDSVLYTYSEAKLNPGLPETAYTFTAPPGARRENKN
jgi:outer membrane lipoprotein-sorting protein